MKKLIKIEIFKIMKKPTFIILGLTLFLPLILTIFFINVPESYKITYDWGNGKIPLFSFPTLALGFFQTFGIFPIIFSFLAISLAQEIETGYIDIYQIRVKKRTKIITSKIIALIIILTGWGILYFLMGLLSYMFFYKFPSIISSLTLFDNGTWYYLIMFIIFILNIFFSMMLTFLLGIKFKSLQCIIGNVFYLFLSMLFINIPLIKYILPEYWINQMMSFTQKDVINIFIVNFIFFILFLIMYIIFLFKKIYVFYCTKDL